MRYIGCKKRLLPFIHEAMIKHNIQGKTFCDLFAGTGTVGHYFKQLGFKILSNDFLYVSYVMQQVKVGINTMPSFENILNHLNLKIQVSRKKSVKGSAKESVNETNAIQAVIDYLNELPGIQGFIYQHYAAGGTDHQTISPRLYFTDDNAQRIDVIRQTLEEWKNTGLVNEGEFYLLLYALLEATSHCANTTATMSSFLKRLQKRSLKPLQLNLPQISFGHSESESLIYCKDSFALLKQLDPVDILYVDPPYTKIQYAAAYHLLETIARWDAPRVYGVSGKRDAKHLNSAFNKKTEALAAITEVLDSQCYQHLLLSYSSDGFVSHEALLTLLQKYGEVAVSVQPLKRYNSLSPHDPRFNAQSQVEERLYYLKPER